MARRNGKSWPEMSQQYRRITDNLPLADRDDLYGTPEVRRQNARLERARNAFDKYTDNLFGSRNFQGVSSKRGLEAAFDTRFPRRVYMGGRKAA